MNEIPERIIISRKGFDSKYGGCASPILPDGTLLSMPIQEDKMPFRYSDLHAIGIGNLGDVVSKLRGCNVGRNERVHLDPDLRKELYGTSGRSWRPIFGQSDAAARHLAKQDVGSGDLFLFFGWFRRVNPKLEFDKDAHDEHVLWGWLQVDRCLDPLQTEPEWAKHHPHYVKKQRKYNAVYIGRQTLTLDVSKPGAGTFSQYHSDLRLTHPDCSRHRSQWRLPSFFANGKLTYHPNADWPLDGLNCSGPSARIGQEFVFKTAGYEVDVAIWLKQLFSHVPRGMSY